MVYAVSVGTVVFKVLAYTGCIYGVKAGHKIILWISVTALSCLTCCIVTLNVYAAMGLGGMTDDEVRKELLQNDEDIDVHEYRMAMYIAITAICVCTLLFNTLIVFACCVYSNYLDARKKEAPDIAQSTKNNLRK